MTRVDRHVGQRLRERRLDLEKTSEQLASALDLSVDEYEELEAGQRRLGPQLMQKAGAFLDVTPAFFFQGLDLMPQPTSSCRNLH